MSSYPDGTTATAHLLSLLEDYHSLNPSEPPVLPWPTSIQFSKQVSKGLPCVYSLPSFDTSLGLARISASTSSSDLHAGSIGAADEASQFHSLSNQFQSSRSWTQQTLIEHLKEKVEVAATPDGRADALCVAAGEKVFLQPANVYMTIDELLQKLCRPSSLPQAGPQPVYYLQSQNSNLTTTSLSPLLDDLPSNITFAKEVLGEPEAVNIWIGTEQSVTSTHRDPYENLYVVLKGKKDFTLWAPVEEVTLNGMLVQALK